MKKISFALVFNYLKIALILAVAFYFFKLVFNNFVADIYYEKSQDAVSQVELSNALDYANKAIRLNPLEPNYYRMRARVYISYLPRQKTEIQSLLKPEIINDLETAYELNPTNLVTMRNIVPLYYLVAVQNVSIGASPENVDAAYLPYAFSFYERLKDYSPNDVGVTALLAKYEKRLNLMDEYNDSVSKVRKLRPDLLDWYDAFK